MPNSWGKPPYPGRDFKGLAFWVLVIGIVLFLIFPNFFKGIYSGLTEATSGTSNLGDVSLPTDANSGDAGTSAQGTLTLGGDTASGVSSGYWIIFVGNGEFKQLSVNEATYNFILNLIQSDPDKSSPQTVMLVRNGQIAQYEVNQDIYSIINNVATINGRVVQGSQG